MKSHKRRRPAGGVRKVPEKLPSIPNLVFTEKVGQGHFSEVYKGIYNETTPVAVKIIERGSEHLISLEVDLLNKLRNIPNIVQLLQVIRDEQTILIFEFIDGIDEKDLFDELTPERMKWLIKNLIIAVDSANTLGIVHRDIKIGNIIVSKDFSQMRLIDWGCGAYISDELSSKAGSRTCRSPEMLIGFKGYRTNCDAWAVGVFIFYILTESDIPWKGKTSEEVVKKMTKIFGGKEIIKLAQSLGITIEEEVQKNFSAEPSITFEQCFSESQARLFDPNLIDLMKRLLTVDLSKRLTLEDALNHPYFC